EGKDGDRRLVGYSGGPLRSERRIAVQSVSRSGGGHRRRRFGRRRSVRCRTGAGLSGRGGVSQSLRAAIAALSLAGTAAPAQQAADIDFDSVGRAAPLEHDVNRYEWVGASLTRDGRFIGSA